MSHMSETIGSGRGVAVAKTCDVCGKGLQPMTPEQHAEAVAEGLREGHLLPGDDDPGVVCDDCYQREFKPWWDATPTCHT